MKNIPDQLWSKWESLLSEKKTKVGRPEFDNRKALNGIIYILYTGSQWSFLPEKYGCSSTVHGKFMKWARSGVFKKMMKQAREYYRRRNKKNNWYAFDCISKKAPLAKFSGKNPTDRGKRGIKHGIMINREGAPIFVHVASANTHDSQLFPFVVKNMRKSKNIKIIAADSAFDSKKLYSLCKDKNIALIASVNKRRSKNKHVFQAPHRWIVEQTLGILSWFRGLKICWAKTLESHLSFLQIACSIRLFKMSGIFG